jgi:hypothetical protein
VIAVLIGGAAGTAAALLVAIVVVRRARRQAELEQRLEAAGVDVEVIDELELRRRLREAELKRFLSSSTPPAGPHFVITAEGRVYQLVDGELVEIRAPFGGEL